MFSKSLLHACLAKDHLFRPPVLRDQLLKAGGWTREMPAVCNIKVHQMNGVVKRDFNAMLQTSQNRRRINYFNVQREKKLNFI